MSTGHTYGPWWRPSPDDFSIDFHIFAPTPFRSASGTLPAHATIEDGGALVGAVRSWALHASPFDGTPYWVLVLAPHSEPDGAPGWNTVKVTAPYEPGQVFRPDDLVWVPRVRVFGYAT